MERYKSAKKKYTADERESGNSSGYIGVEKNGKYWYSVIMFNGKRVAKAFKTVEAAAQRRRLWEMEADQAMHEGRWPVFRKD